MTSTNEIGLASERVESSTDIDLSDVHCSTICENILWKPVSCQQCETHFCLKCITKWLTKNPNQCPLRCDSFVQRPCSKFIVKQLSKLKIACIYHPNGCNEIVPYEALEKHEMMCGYKLVKCSTCQSEIPEKNLSEHQLQCSSVRTTSENFQITYEPNAPVLLDSDVNCSTEQFQQYRFEVQSEIRKLRQEIREAQNDQITMLISRGFIMNDHEVERIQLQSTVEIETLSKHRVVLDQNSKMGLNDELLCTECRNVVWKPVYCRQCECIFCYKCRPQIGFFSRVSTFFGVERPRHGRNNCDNFEEVDVPTHIIADLTKLLFRCAYEQNGCRMLIHYYDLEQHEKECQFENIPCHVCLLPLSKRRPFAKHSTHACFQEMYRKNPSRIQQQFMILLNATEKAEAENTRLKLVIDGLQNQINNLDSKYVKKPPAKKD
ncbi:unnamed protein product [Adineta steineri]|uniref:Uncharacterized protein n=1 Tax=Adineta steineri TaxID=433720 RepID=A0A819Q7F7_9BILA|nr:unnamed protein product [Adineta steineri]